MGGTLILIEDLMRESKEEFRFQAREGFTVVEKGQQIRHRTHRARAAGADLPQGSRARSDSSACATRSISPSPGSSSSLPGAPFTSPTQAQAEALGSAAAPRRCRKRRAGRAGPGAALPGQSALPVQHAEFAVVAGDDRPHRPRRNHAAGALDLLPHQPVARPERRRDPGRGDRSPAALSRHREGAFPRPSPRRDRRSAGARAGAPSGASPPADRRKCDQIWRIEEPQGRVWFASRPATSATAEWCWRSATG